MDITHQEMISQEVDSPLLVPELVPDPKPSMERQPSIYSLTLDKLTTTVCENGKNLGSMNMDAFLNSIWIAEEQATNALMNMDAFLNSIWIAEEQATNALLAVNDLGTATNQLSLPMHDNSTYIVDHDGIAKQSTLPRQASIALTAPLSQKTVDEIWTEIQSQQQNISHIHDPTVNSTQDHQLTYAEMTLEDFLIRAGVVGEPVQPKPMSGPIPQQQTYGSLLYPNTNPNLIDINPNLIGTSTFVTTPVMTLGGVSGMTPVMTLGDVSGVNIVSSYQPIMQPFVDDIPSYGDVKRGVETPSPYKGRMGNESGGSYAQVQPLTMVSPVSPNSPVGLDDQADGSSYGMVDVSGAKGGTKVVRKRIIDVPVEEVVERRQRRMIKNRESAAKSRARKQAYTFELEVELNQIKEENTRLKKVIADMYRKKERQEVEEMKMKAETNAKKTHERLRTLRKTTSFLP